MSDQRMTAEEFESHLLSLRSVSKGTVELARLIMVEGMSHSDAAAATGTNRQNVRGKLKTVLARMHGAPAGWVWFEGYLPPDAAAAAKAASKRE